MPLNNRSKGSGNKPWVNASIGAKSITMVIATTWDTNRGVTGKLPTSSNHETIARTKAAAKTVARDDQSPMPKAPIAIQPRLVTPTTAMPPPWGVGRIWLERLSGWARILCRFSSRRASPLASHAANGVIMTRVVMASVIKCSPAQRYYDGENRTSKSASICLREPLCFCSAFILN